MGRPYKDVMNEISQSSEWAMNANITSLNNFIDEIGNVSAYFVGSGGSLTIAHVGAMLHSQKGAFAKAVTPLELSQLNDIQRNSAIILISASGNNPDILSAFKKAISLEPKYFGVICLKLGSKLSIISQKYLFVKLFEFAPPIGRDGFLATNSILIYSILLTRTYKYSIDQKLNSNKFSNYLRSIAKEIKNISDRDTWLVLYGGWGFPAAVDLESKFSEAALGRILLSDYRNFGHGRHFWLSKRFSESGVLAITTPEELNIAKKTFDLLPSNIPKAIISTSNKAVPGMIELLIKIFNIVQFIGQARGIDPGRPGVPTFGRQLYHLNNIIPIPSWKTLKRKDNNLGLPEPIKRKLAIQPLTSYSKNEIFYWKRAYKNFVRNIKKARFSAIVLDYDGTLCALEERLASPSNAIIVEICRLLEAGIYIGIATGRGRSVRQVLSKLIPIHLQSSVIIGYYNGSDIASLEDTEHPIKTPEIQLALQRVVKYLQPFEKKFLSYEIRPKQITISPVGNYNLSFIHALLNNHLLSKNISGIRILSSLHSIDILSESGSKLDVITKCKLISNSKDILCIGDQGAFPGNDYELLSSQYSLSVDSVSVDPLSCWNLSRSGIRGVQATLFYLRQIKVRNNIANFSI